MWRRDGIAVGHAGHDPAMGFTDGGDAPTPMMSTYQTVAALMDRWWPADIPGDRRDVECRRFAFQVDLVLSRLPRGGRHPVVCDLGGGWGLVLATLRRLGYDAILVDDFADPGAEVQADACADMAPAEGVRTIRADVVHDILPFADESIDAFISFDSIEHWHASPRAMFARAMAQLRPGGLVIIGAPNCVNLRKRLTVPFGYGKWSGMAEWYFAPRFRGHVREPDTDDLRAIARDMGLMDVVVLGRNWMGYRKASPILRALTTLADGILRFAPALCADLYMIGRKPGAA